MSAPESNNNSAHLVCPAATAQRKGVIPLASLQSTAARFFRRISTNSRFPKDAALKKGKGKLYCLSLTLSAAAFKALWYSYQLQQTQTINTMNLSGLGANACYWRHIKRKNACEQVMIDFDFTSD